MPNWLGHQGNICFGEICPGVGPMLFPRKSYDESLLCSQNFDESLLCSQNLSICASLYFPNLSQKDGINWTVFNNSNVSSFRWALRARCVFIFPRKFTTRPATKNRTFSFFLVLSQHFFHDK